MGEEKKIKKLAVVSSQYLKEKSYWLDKLSGELIKNSFPYDYKHKKKTVYRWAKVFKPGFAGKHFPLLLKLRNKSDVRLHMILVAGLTALLSKYTYNKDIMLGCPTLRQDLDIEVDFINTVLILRNDIHQNMSFKELLLQVRQTLTRATENQNYPLERLLYQLNIPVHGPGEEFPLFDVAIMLENIHTSAYLQHVRFNLLFSFKRVDESLDLVVEYNLNLYKQATVERIISQLEILFGRALENVDLRVSALGILKEEEREELLSALNNTGVFYEKDKTIHQSFVEQVESTPDRAAIVGDRKLAVGKESNILLTYRELNHQSHQLTHLLREKGVKPDTIVAIMVGRSLDMVIGILGILKAGGAYLPVDPDYPEERINYMLSDSGAKILVATPGLSEKFEKLLIVNCQFNSPFKRGASSLTLTSTSTCQVSSANLAYIIYTSGTTGKPKGVLIEHGNIMRLMFHDNYLFDFNINEIWTLFHSCCFDFSVWEMLGALLYGAKLVVVHKMTARDPRLFLEILKKETVTILNQTPAAFYALTSCELSGSEKQLNLKYVIFGGEALQPAKLKQWKEKYPGTRLINMFGITETTVHVTYKEIEDEDIELDISNIGSPIPTLSCYVMDESLTLVPIGGVGEICVGGEGVCRGYLNRPQLTKEKFVEDPYLSGGRLYRSGDLGKLAESYQMEYLGRIDHQVKIRGFRIEPGEIASQLLTHRHISEALVTIIEDSPGELRSPLIDGDRDRHLCAYIVSEKELGVSELREYLSGTLPGYMVPSYFVRLEKMPLTPHGKVDRKALPGPEFGIEVEYAAPRDEIEEKLVGIWSGVLGIEKKNISLDTDFFAVGGHSIKAAAMIMKIHKELNVELPLAEIFKTPTIRELSECIKKLTKGTKGKYVSIELAEKKEFYGLSSAQKRLYSLEQIYEQRIATTYNIPSVSILEGEINRAKLEDTFRHLIERHESLRTSFEEVGEEPVQRVHEHVKFEIEYYEYPLFPAPVPPFQEGNISAPYLKIIDNFVRPFALSRAPLLRVGLIKAEEEKHFLVLDMHHIITDGISMALFVKDFLLVYQGENLPPLRLRYRDYSEWQNSESQKETIKKQEKYWLNQFDGELPVLNLTTDYGRSLVQAFEGRTVGLDLGKENSEWLYELALKEGTTVYMVLLTIYNVLLSKISGQEDIMVGIPILGRRHADLEQIIGMFVNTLALRNFPKAEKTFIEFLKEVKERTIQAFENQDYQLEDLLEKVVSSRNISRNPLFDVMFEFRFAELDQDLIPGEITPGLKVKPYKYDERTSRIDFILVVKENNGRIYTTLEYCTKLYKEKTMVTLLKHYKRILDQVAEDTEIKIKQVELMDKEEGMDISSSLQKDMEGIAVDFEI